VWVNKCLSFFLVPSWSSSTPFYPPQSAANQGVCPNFWLFHCFHFKLTFWIYLEFWERVIQCSMGYKPTYGSQSNVQTLEECFFQCIIMCSIFWVHESGEVSWGSNYGICERLENFLNFDIHGDKIMQLALWTFGFGGVYVCIVVLYYWSFSLWRWINEKARKDLMASIAH
jgi:hypothetical protein